MTCTILNVYGNKLLFVPSWFYFIKSGNLSRDTVLLNRPVTALFFLFIINDKREETRGGVYTQTNKTSTTVHAVLWYIL